MEARKIRNKKRKTHKKLKTMQGFLEEKAQEKSVLKKALNYQGEKEKVVLLQKEIDCLTSQLSFRSYACRGTFPVNSKNVWTKNENLVRHLPSYPVILPDVINDSEFDFGSGRFGCVTIGYIHSIGVEVAIKKSKGFSQNTEGRIYQALSGHPNFLFFFGMQGNNIVTELVKIYDSKEKFYVSSTLDYALTNQLKGSKFDWINISKGIITGIDYMHGLNIIHNDIKENNVLLKEVKGIMIPKISDFGKAALASQGSVFNLEENQRKLYNEKHRHIAPELRNLNGFVQSTVTDAYSVGRVLKQIGYIMDLKSVKLASSYLKMDDCKKRKTLEFALSLF